LTLRKKVVLYRKKNVLNKVKGKKMKKFAQFIGALPFLGRMKIRPAVYSFYLSTSKEERQTRYLRVMGLLIIMILIHVCLAWFGFEALSFHAPLWVKVVYVVYALTNSAVVLTQIYLCVRVSTFLGMDLYPHGIKNQHTWTISERRAMWGVTLGGNLVFFVCFFFYWSTFWDIVK
jgi:hypothetical protein